MLLATTTVTVRRPDTNAAPYEQQADATLISAGVPAHIGQESGRGLNAGAPQDSVTWRLDCDLVDLVHGDLIEDERSHDTFVVTWARPRVGLGLDHVEAQLLQTSARNPVGA